jgi:hypothetical protein
MKYQKRIWIRDEGNEGVLNRFEMSAIIGFWRMGNKEAVIAGVMNVSLGAVYETIRYYKATLNN